VFENVSEQADVLSVAITVITLPYMKKGADEE